MTTRPMSPELKTYYEVRYDKLIEELRRVADLLGRPDPIQPRKQRRARVVVAVDGPPDSVT